MNDDSGSSKSGILVSFVVGGLAGAAVALLLAPQSGQGTRGLLNQRIREGIDRGRLARKRMASKEREVLDGKRQEDFAQRQDRHFAVEAAPQPKD